MIPKSKKDVIPRLRFSRNARPAVHKTIVHDPPPDFNLFRPNSMVDTGEPIGHNDRYDVEDFSTRFVQNSLLTFFLRTAIILFLKETNTVIRYILNRMIKKLLTILFVFFLCQETAYIGLTFAVDETARPYDLQPYRIQVLLFQDEESGNQKNKPFEQDVFCRTLQNRLSALIGNFWQIEISYKKTADWQESFSVLDDPAKPLPEIWQSFDKIFFVFFERSSSVAVEQKIRVRQLDTATRYLGSETIGAIAEPSKVVDFLVRTFLEQFSPITRLEHASMNSATLRIRGERLFHINNPMKTKSGLIPASGDVLIPFVRSLDSEENLVGVFRIDWTILVAESTDSQTGLLQCRIESGQRDPLGRRRRGRTEIYAISVPTPMEPTLIRLQARSNSGSNFLPRCDVFEKVPGKDKPVLIGQSNLNGLFRLEAESDRPFRLCQFRSGRTLIAQLPIVRGLETELVVPVSDDPIRLEAEAAIIRIQEEVVDVKARRSILNKRLEKAQNDGKDKLIRDTRAELSQLKDNERFLLELKQAQVRFRSDDPLVQRRIDRMFRTTEQTIRQYSSEKSFVPVELEQTK